jgi:hypothetical protein
MSTGISTDGPHKQIPEFLGRKHMKGKAHLRKLGAKRKNYKKRK